ncbi:DUF6597 domain-containing transcriptional factor [Maribacter sp. IgM3_T14_3]|uniref:DUF6597 domain-containing transcriptional factor n=1 Tax=Maribacter sp. IgM3_T14_3 TaxID=3415140 RepID=UPI003C7037DC
MAMFELHPVCEKLQPYISFYYEMKWERKDYNNGIHEVVLPSGKAFMVFQYEGRFRGIIFNQEIDVPKFYTIGQQTSNYAIFSDFDTMGLVGVAFKPTGLNHFFGLDISKLTNTPTDSFQLFTENIKSFETVFDKQQQTENRIALVEELLVAELGTKTFKKTFIDISIDLMDESLGCKSISSIIKKLNVSERYFQKKFKQIVGVAPSVYNRIVRFNHLFSEYDAHDLDNNAKLSSLFNYYDLSHFRKDFKKYCGAAPKKFHLERFKFINQAFVKNPIFLNQTVQSQSKLF